MSALSRLLRQIAPGAALKREIAGAQFDLLQERRKAMAGGNYEPTGGGRRSTEFRYNNQDAMLAQRGERAQLSYIARDMLRNNPRVVRANNLVANYTIGAGIMPTVTMKSDEDDKAKSRIEGLIADHLLTKAVDADGLCNLPAMQALAMSTIPASGEVLYRVRWRKSSDALPLPFQIQLLEPDFLNATVDGSVNGGARIEQGIEYSPIGAVQAYHLFTQHPGGIQPSFKTTRVAAENIAHSFLPTRPGERRGVSWYAPVMTQLLDLHKLMSATLKQAEVAAMFAGILKTDSEEYSDILTDLQAGTIFQIGSQEALDFTNPPQSGNAEPIIRVIDRIIAACLMLPVEAFTGDYTGLNYSGGRMARMDTDPSVARWQRHVVINQQMVPVGGWFKKAVAMQEGIDADSYKLDWTPPRRPVVDPTKDWPALREKVKAGFASRRAIIREAGDDPARVDAEILEERNWAGENEISFSSSETVPADVADESNQKGKPDGKK